MFQENEKRRELEKQAETRRVQREAEQAKRRSGSFAGMRGADSCILLPPLDQFAQFFASLVALLNLPLVDLLGNFFYSC